MSRSSQPSASATSHLNESFCHIDGVSFFSSKKKKVADRVISPKLEEKIPSHEKASGGAKRRRLVVSFDSPIDVINELFKRGDALENNPKYDASQRYLKAKLSPYYKDKINRLQHAYTIRNKMGFGGYQKELIEVLEILQTIESPGRDRAFLEDNGYTPLQIQSIEESASGVDVSGKKSSALFSLRVYQEMLALIATIDVSFYATLLHDENYELARKIFKTLLYRPLLDATLSKHYKKCALYSEGFLDDDNRVIFSNFLVNIAQQVNAYQGCDLSCFWNDFHGRDGFEFDAELGLYYELVGMAEIKSDASHGAHRTVSLSTIDSGNPSSDYDPEGLKYKDYDVASTFSDYLDYVIGGMVFDPSACESPTAFEDALKQAEVLVASHDRVCKAAKEEIAAVSNAHAVPVLRGQTGFC